MKQKYTNTASSILCVHQGYELYGSDRSFALSVETLQKLYPNTKIDVIIPKDGPIRQILEPVCNNLIINEDLAILRKKELKNNPFRLIYKIMHGIKSAIENSKKYDLVYVNTIVVIDYIIAARFMKCLTVLHIREIPTGFQRTVFSKMVSLSKMNLIFNSHNTLRTFNLPKDQSKSVILNGVKGFMDIAPKESTNSTINILLIGRLTPWKGQMFFLETLNQLMKNNDYNLNVRIVGEVFEDQVSYKNDLLAFVKNNHLENIVTFKSFTDNPKNEYEWSDIVIVPSIKPEPFGRVAIEAMSASRCVVAANHGGLTEIITGGIDGVLFEPNNIDSLVESLKEILNTPKLMYKYNEEGLQTFENRFSDKIYQHTFKEVIHDIVDDSLMEENS